MTMTSFIFDDGGRATAGYKGTTCDCVVRSISIATGLPYQKVYADLNKLVKDSHQTKTARRSNSRSGMGRRFYQAYLESLGWEWVAIMKIGIGCKMHLRKDELPKGRIIARVSKHMVAVIDGIIHDTFDPSRDGTRCVYGYFRKVQVL